MIQKFLKWYQSRTVIVQLLLAFSVYFIFWMGVSFIRQHWFERRTDSPLRFFLESVFMAFFITLFFEWRKVKVLFNKKNNQSGR